MKQNQYMPPNSNTEETQFSSGVNLMHYIVFLFSILLFLHLEDEATNTKLKAQQRKGQKALISDKILKQRSKESIF